MRRTLLKIVQEILTSMGSDQVNSITDTQESIDIAETVRAVFYDCATDFRLNEQQSLFELTASTSSAQPVLMTLPEKVVRLDWIKYNNKEDADTYSEYKEVSWCDFPTFLELSQSLREDTTGVDTMSFTMNNGDTFEYIYKTDAHPSLYTFVDNTTILFDSINLEVDTSLQSDKTMCYGVVYPDFTISDTFIPPLDPASFSYLVNKATIKCFDNIKQQQSPYAAQEARRQKIILRKRNERIQDQSTLFKINKARYGRT